LASEVTRFAHAWRRLKNLRKKNTSWEKEKINFFVEQFVGIQESIQSSHSSFKLLSLLNFFWSFWVVLFDSLVSTVDVNTKIFRIVIIEWWGCFALFLRWIHLERLCSIATSKTVSCGLRRNLESAILWKCLWRRFYCFPGIMGKFWCCTLDWAAWANRYSQILPKIMASSMLNGRINTELNQQVLKYFILYWD
jgi:hypothetical protein